MESLNFPVEILPTDTFSINVFFTPLNIGQSVDTIVVVIENRNFQAVRRILGQGVNTSDIEDENTLFKEFELSNNYPNPFNPSTTIEYTVPKLSNVKISVFNLIGEEVLVLVNEEKDYGEYQIEFTAKNLPSGIYFYKMQSENFVATKKFVLLK